MPESPEARARQNIDQLLTAAGWAVQFREDTNLNAGRGVAIREFSTQLRLELHVTEHLRGLITTLLDGHASPISNETGKFCATPLSEHMTPRLSANRNPAISFWVRKMPGFLWGK